MVQTWPNPRSASRTTGSKNGIKKPQPQRYGSLKGEDQVPEERALCQEAQKKGMKKMQTNKAMSSRAKDIKARVKLKEVKLKIPKGQQPQA